MSSYAVANPTYGICVVICKLCCYSRHSVRKGLHLSISKSEILS